MWAHGTVGEASDGCERLGSWPLSGADPVFGLVWHLGAFPGNVRSSKNTNESESKPGIEMVYPEP